MSVTYRPYNDGISSAAKASTPLPAIPLSAMEIVTYYPHHCQHGEILFRLLRSGWDAPTISKAQLHARNNLSHVELKRRHAAIRKQISTAGTAKFGVAWNGVKGACAQDAPDLKPIKASNFTAPTHPNGMVDYYDTSNAMGSTYRGRALGPPATLQDLCAAVHNPPQGDDAGLLTQCIWWAIYNGFDKPDGTPYDTDDIDDIVQAQGFVLPTSAHTDLWDTGGARRAASIVNPPKPVQKQQENNLNGEEEGEGEDEKDESEDEALLEWMEKLTKKTP